MIHGIRLFPWVSDARAKKQDNGDYDAHTYLDCSTCKMRQKEREWHSCAYVPKKKRKGFVIIPPGYPHERPDVCPGYLAALPEAIESARAYSWRKDGALAQFYDQITPRARLCIDLAAAEFRSVEQYNIRESARKREQ